MFDKKSYFIVLNVLVLTLFCCGEASAKSLDDVSVFGYVAENCACTGPAFGDTWKNHGAYVSCVAHAVNSLAKTGLIAKQDKGEIVSQAAASACGKAEDDVVINPLDIFLDEPDGIVLNGVSTTSFNPRNVTLDFVLTGTEFFQNLDEVTLTISGRPVAASGINLSSTNITASVRLYDGRNNIYLKAYDVIGRPVYFSKTVWAGSNNLTVYVVDRYSRLVYETTNIKLSLSDDVNVTYSGTTNAGYLILNNVPSRTLLAEARTTDNRSGISGGLGTERYFVIRLLDFGDPSAIDNNDLSLGTTEGWNTYNSSVSIIEHIEGFPTTSSALAIESSKLSDSSRMDRASAENFATTNFNTTNIPPIANHDLKLITSGVGARPTSRTFRTKKGTNSVIVRYRFVTTEVPAGYFGSKYNDYYSVTLRSLAGEDTVIDANSMNTLGLIFFDYRSGATSWRTVTLDTDPAGDVIQVDILVSNVADRYLNSAIVIDYIEEKQEEKVQPSLAWNSTTGGLTLTYTVLESDLIFDATIEAFWAQGEDYNSRLGDAFFNFVVPAGTLAGTSDSVSIPGADLSENPDEMTHILAASSESKIGVLADVLVTYGIHADANVVTAEMLDIVEDGFRAAGQATNKITSTARTAEDQARAMFNNLVNSEKTVAENIAYQNGIYGVNGEAVINVFVAQTVGLTLELINANSVAIKAAMEAEVNALGPSNVSKHCADPDQVTVVDVGSRAFEKNGNGQLFVDSVTPRVTTFLDEVSENHAYHLVIE